MQFNLKSISEAAVNEALHKAERYRLLKEPSQAESICLDVLRVEPQNQRAWLTLLLALTEQFVSGVPAEKAREILPRLRGDYEQAYFAGVISERLAHSEMRRHLDPQAIETMRDAMRFYETAEALRPPGNDDAILRWNACARFLMKHHDA